MRKYLSLFAIAVLVHLVAYPQATSLTVDCQMPGWLSSMINYGDQQTITDLKITGFINATDLRFIGTLIKNQSLNGCIDLEDVEITPSNEMNTNAFKLTSSCEVRKVILPKTLQSATQCLNYLEIDTLIAGGVGMHVIKDKCFFYLNGNTSNLILREGTDTIESVVNGTTIDGFGQLKSLELPEGLRYIGRSFQKCTNLNKIHFSNTIEVIEDLAFQETSFEPDTLFLPDSLKIYNMPAFPLKEKQVIYIPKNVTGIKNYTSSYQANSYWQYIPYITRASDVEIHIKAPIPPGVSDLSGTEYQHSSGFSFKGLTIYVPKGCKELYESKVPWSRATIVEETVVPQIIDIGVDSITLIPNESMQLIASVFPENADTDVNWASSDNRVASVDTSGVVLAKNKGIAVIYATTTDGSNLVDSCLVKVVQPVVGVTMEKHSLSLKVGGSEQLYANVLPVNADNKKLIWSSTDNEIAEVDAEGNVTALKPGNAFIKATSEDNPMAVDSCKLTVLQPVTGITLNYSKYGFNQIGATAQLIATITPDDASNKEVQWHSSNESICFISNGTIVSTGYGTCVVLATTVDGGHLASCIVDVYKSGDVNRDGVINIGDITTIIDMLLDGTGSEYDSIWADVNSDGAVSISDVTDLIDQLLNSSN